MLNPRMRATVGAISTFALGKLVVCSDQLTAEEERIARAIAADRIRRGVTIVMLNVIELMAVIQDAA